MKVKEYIGNKVTPFILPSMLDNGDAVCTTEFQTNLTEYIKRNLGSLKVRDGIIRDCLDNEGNIDEEELEAWIRSDCSNMYIINKYKYDHLYASTIQVYDPIENYRMVETEESEGGETRSGTFTKGSATNSEQGSVVQGSHTDTHSETINKGTHTDSIQNSKTNGAKTDTLTDTNVYGAKSETTDNGANGGVTHSHNVAPFDSDTLHPETQDVDSVVRKSETGYTDTLTHENVQGASTDSETGSTTYGAEEDTNSASDVYGGKTDTTTNSITEGQRIDTDASSSSNTNERTLTRSGNIGVTTSQQMLESERQIALFSLYKVVAKDIMDILAIRVYEVEI